MVPDLALLGTEVTVETDMLVELVHRMVLPTELVEAVVDLQVLVLVQLFHLLRQAELAEQELI